MSRRHRHTQAKGPTPFALVVLIALVALTTGCEFRLGVRSSSDGPFPFDGLFPPTDLGPRPEGFVPPADLGDGTLPDQGPTDPCAGKICSSPPAPSCNGAKTLDTHEPIGVCHTGSCTYAKKVQTCAGSCVGGTCLSATSFLHVDANNGGAEDGSTKAPYRTIGAALVQAASGSAILVAGGTYAESVAIQQKTIELIGGYIGGSAADYSGAKGGNFGGRDPAIHVTTIQASGAGPSVLLRQAGKSLVAGFSLLGAGRGLLCEGGGPTVSGNRIAGHKGNLPGAGVRASKSCNLQLVGNVIENNTGSRGGGIETEGGNVLIAGNVVRGNVAKDDHGGGMYLVSGEVDVRDNRVEGNTVGVSKGYGWGGGIALIGAKATLSGNVVFDNHATTFGSGVFVDDGSDVLLENELYYGNVCADGGAGLYVDGLSASVHSKATLINVTIADHACSGGVGQALLVEESTVTVKSSIFWNNGGGETYLAGGSLTISYTNASKKLPGTGNISVAPQFAGSGAGAYHLRSKGGRWDGAKWVQDATTSPCIDKGDPTTGVGTEPAKNGGRANLGAFGRTATASKSP